MDIPSLFQNPDRFLLAFDPPSAVFVQMNREAYRRSIFCDGRIVAASKKQTAIPYQPLVDAYAEMKPAPPDISFIFHIAHCGSTLLSKALEFSDETLVCREPLALRQLGAEYANKFAGGRPPADWSSRLKLVTGLLGRRYDDNSQVIVKANVPVNFIIPQTLDNTSARPSLFLYFPLEHYLLAVLRTPHHRQWVMNVCNELRRGIEVHAPLPEGMSVAQAAASLWFAQIKNFADALEAQPKAASLNAEAFFEEPRKVLKAAFTHFNIPYSEEQLNDVMHGELFSHYSKKPDVKFDNAMRVNARQQLQKAIHNEINEARDWIASIIKNESFPTKLTSPLVGESPDLLAAL